MTVLFRADASPSLGLGHLSRCLALAQAFESLGDTSIFLTLGHLKQGGRWLLKQGQSVIELPQYKNLDTEAYEVSNLAKALNASLVVLDTYELTNHPSKQLEKYVRRLDSCGLLTAAIDDEGAYPASIIINPRMDLRPNPKKTHGLTELLGGKYALLRREFSQAEHICDVRRDVANVLVTMGGSDPHSFTPVAVAGLAGLGLRIHVAYGALMGNAAAIKAAAGDSLYIHKEPEMATLMAGCDIAISAAGCTAMELFAIGLPSLFIVQADNQRPLGLFLARHGLLLGECATLLPHHIKAAATKLAADYNQRLSIHKFMLTQVDRNGAANTAQALKEAVLKARACPTSV